MSASAFFRAPPSHIAVSPDGERIVGVLERDGERFVFLKPVREAGVRALVKLDPQDDVVRELGWAGDSMVVLAIDSDPGSIPDARSRTRGGAHWLRVVSVSVARWRRPVPSAGWLLPTRSEDAVAVLHWLPEDRDRILVDRWESEEGGATAQLVSVDRGFESTVAAAPPRVQRWFADAKGVVRAGRSYDPEANVEVDYARASADAAFQPLADSEEVLTSELAFAGFAADPGTIYVTARAENGRLGLFEYDLERRRRTRLLYADEEFDVGQLIYSPSGAELWAVEVEGERPSLHFVDEDGRREYAAIQAALPDTTARIVSASRDGAIAIVHVSGDTRPPRYFVYDRARREMSLLYDTLPELTRVPLAPTRAVSYRARDGLEIPAYLTAPPGADPSNLPVIVILHDGPTERAHWGFDATVQFLASRGFAVFQPNFRGSSGYGLDFERRGYGEWGGAMQEDVVDGVRWLVSEGIADPDRIGVYGRGYGGYAALLALATSPDLFRAGAAWGSLTDRAALLDRPGEYASDDWNHPTAGATPGDREALTARSPAHLAESIRVPVFIAHGSRDRVVSVAQLHAMTDALEAADREFESEEYRNQGHELSDEWDRIDFHERLVRFFEKNLSPRVPL